MADLTYVLPLCLLAGFAFAYLAYRLTTSKGNTIRDILSAPHFKDAQALKLEIADKVKLSTNIPIVGLYVMSVLVAIGLPALIVIYGFREAETVTLHGNLNSPSGIVDARNIYAHQGSLLIYETGDFYAPLLDIKDYQTITFESPAMYPITLTIQYKKEQHTLSIQNSFASEAKEIPVERGTARLLPPIQMAVKENVPPPPNVPSQASDEKSISLTPNSQPAFLK